MKPLYFGADLSLNHSGIVFINSKGKVIDQFYFHTTKKLVLKSLGGYYLQRPTWTRKSTETDNWNLVRLLLLSEWFTNILNDVNLNEDGYRIKVGAVEGYAHGYGRQSKSRSSFQTGGMIEQLKLIIYQRYFPFRIIDPQTLRAWIKVPRGGDKTHAINKAVDVGFKLVGDNRIFDVKKGEGPASDLADAYWLADMVRVERLVRKGKIELSELPEHQRNLFLKVTKTQKVNLLARDYVYFQSE